MQTSEQIKEIAAALAKAQAAMHGATKDRKNPAFKSDYATLSSVIEAARGPLTENGIAFIQSPGAIEDAGVPVTTTLVHSSGEWFRSTVLMPVRDRNNPQAVGSAITYGCRYSLMAMLGLPPVDDDGNAAAQGGPRPNGNGNQAAQPHYGRVASAPRALANVRAAQDEEPSPFDDDLSSEARDAFLASAKAIISSTTREYADIVIWWNAEDQKKQRRDFDLSAAQIDELKAMIAARRPSQKEAAE